MTVDIVKLVTPIETLTLTSSPYTIVKPGFAPSIPILNPSAVGGLIYSDVMNSIEIGIYGDTKAAARSNLQKLMRAFDAADRWWHGDVEFATPAYLEWTTDSAVYKSVIKGVRDFGGRARRWSSLPDDYRYVSETGHISPIEFSFRSGPWLITSESAVVTSPLTGKSSDLLTATFASTLDEYGIVKVEFEETLSNANLDIFNGYLVWSNETDGLQVEEGENFFGSGLTATAVSEARGGSVGRINLASTNKTTYERNTLPVTWPANQFYIFANLIAASNSFTVQIRVNDDAGNEVKSKEVIVSSTDSGVKFFGLHSLPGDIGVIYVDVTPDTASVNLDLDWVMLVRADNAAQGALKIDKNLSNEDGDFVFDHQLLSERTYGFFSNNGTKVLPTVGSGYIYTEGGQMRLALLGNGNLTGSYAIEGNASGTPADLEFTVTRTPIRLIPE